MNMAPVTAFMNYLVNLINQFGLLDVLFVVILFIGLLHGFRQGMSKMFLNIIKLAIILTLTIEYSGPVVNSFSISSPIVSMLAQLFSFLVFTTAFYFVARLIFGLLGKLLKIQFAEFIEKTGGAVLGGVFWMFVVSYLIYFILLIPGGWFQETLEKRTLAGTYLMQATPLVHRYARQVIPAEWRAAHFEETGSKTSGK